MNTNQLSKLLESLLNHPTECEWIEFKHNNKDPQMIGQTISALANSARLKKQSYGYLVWGIDDATHEVLGTDFQPNLTKKGNEELENWLVRLLIPRLDIKFYCFQYKDKPIVILETSAALHSPVRFEGREYIRVGSLSKPLNDYTEKERALWLILNTTNFEKGIAKTGLDADQTLQLLDYPKYFELTKQRLPDSKQGVLDKLCADDLILNALADWQITNLGAILFAKNLADFGNLVRKGLRVIEYEGKNRIKTKREQAGAKGYAAGFEGAINYINDRLPQSEHIKKAFREEIRTYPELAIRELVANALIHQDFTITGAGPMVEIFQDRIEITNPGHPLMDTLRMMDEPPRSRNETLASLMRRMWICEERGSGIDKVINEVERYHLPAPSFVLKEQAMVVTLYDYVDSKHMSKEQRTQACYQHACLKYVSNDVLTNTSLRDRFNISDKNSAYASRIIKETVEAGLIKHSNPENKSLKHRQYQPFWA